MKVKSPIIYNSVENMFLFAITDIDTQRDLSSFFGKTKITRIQKSGNLKAKADIREEEIELIEDDFILFKLGLLKPQAKQKQQSERGMPPAVLYYVVKDKWIKQVLTVGVKAREGSYLALFNDTKSIIDLLDTDPDKLKGISLILQINIKQMIEDGYKVIGDKKGKWFTKEIPSKYISVLK